MSSPQSSAPEIITGHKNLREALRNTDKYSSDLQGDADVRDYRQIPLEVDPPRHHLYRSALAPIFVKPAIEKHVPKFQEIIGRFLSEYFSGSSRNVVSDLALPIVMHNLGVIYNRAQDVEEWISWGPDVWTAASSQRDGAVLHNYLDRIYAQALEGRSKDAWSFIADLEIEGKKVTPVEFRGIASVLLAGGRDTVVKLLTGIIWHLAKQPEYLVELRRDSQLLLPAIQEYLRFFSPLPLMNRTTTPETDTKELPPDRYVGMSFISGNFDDSVFEKPTNIDFKRFKNPHLSFGFGPHTCLGNHIAEIESKVFLQELVNTGMNWVIKSEKIVFHKAPLDMVPDHFRSIVLSQV